MKGFFKVAMSVPVLLAMIPAGAWAQSSDDLSCNSGQILARDPAVSSELQDRQATYTKRLKQLTGYEPEQAKFLTGLLNSFSKDGTLDLLRKSLSATASNPQATLSEAASDSIASRISAAFKNQYDGALSGWYTRGTPKTSSVCAGDCSNPQDGFTDDNRPPIFTDSFVYKLGGLGDDAGDTDEPAFLGRNDAAMRNIRIDQSSGSMKISETTYFGWTSPYTTKVNPNSTDPVMPREITTTIDVATGAITQTLKNASDSEIPANGKYYADTQSFLKGIGSMPQNCPDVKAGLTPSLTPQTTQDAALKAPDQIPALNSSTSLSTGVPVAL